eukprot:g24589.t1
MQGRMVHVIPGFSMETFLPELNNFIQSGAADHGDAKKVVDLLNSWADFISFKDTLKRLAMVAKKPAASLAAPKAKAKKDKRYKVKGFLHLGLGLRVGQTYAEKDLVIRSK